MLEALEARCRHWQAYVFSLRTVGSSRPELRDASAEANLKHVHFHRLVGRGNAALVAALGVAMLVKSASVQLESSLHLDIA